MRAIAGCADAEQLARQCGWLMATEVLAVGLDLSFAPVLDLDHERSAVIAVQKGALLLDPMRTPIERAKLKTRPHNNLQRTSANSPVQNSLDKER